MKTLSTVLAVLALTLAAPFAHAGKDIANGWYKGQEIYYIDQGMQKNVGHSKTSDIFLVGDNRKHQSNVVLTIPGDPGYSPQWDVVIVHSAPGITVQNIINAGFASPQFATTGVLFESAESIRQAANYGLVTLTEPGLVVLCPIVSSSTADANGHTEAPETFMILTGSSTF